MATAGQGWCDYGCIAMFINNTAFCFCKMCFVLALWLTAGIDKVGLDGTLYDQVLDWIFALGLAPFRFSKLSGYDLYFAMARGTEGAVALDMSKFFDTNYHYMVCFHQLDMEGLCFQIVLYFCFMTLLCLSSN